MANSREHLESVLAFIREHRSSESNFEKIYAKLEEEVHAENNGFADLKNSSYFSSIKEIKEKQATVYEQRKEISSSNWPEFENFVSSFEKTVNDTLKEVK